MKGFTYSIMLFAALVGVKIPLDATSGHPATGPHATIQLEAFETAEAAGMEPPAPTRSIRQAEFPLPAPPPAPQTAPHTAPQAAPQETPSAAHGATPHSAAHSVAPHSMDPLSSEQAAGIDPVAWIMQATGTAVQDGTNYVGRALFSPVGAHVFRDCDICPEMVRLPPGRFFMGDGSGRGLDDERPRHEVTLPYAFALGRFEVTQGEWIAIMDRNDSEFQFWNERSPVEWVSWNQAATYLERLNQRLGLTGRRDRYRLPTEAEWEYAARGGTLSVWWCGETRTCLDAIAWYGNNSGDTTNWVGQLRPNSFGLYDMTGNVAEWTADCYRVNAYHRFEGYPAAIGLPGERCLRVVRGGAWNDTMEMVRTAIRGWQSADERGPQIGFRVARTLLDEAVSEILNTPAGQGGH